MGESFVYIGKCVARAQRGEERSVLCVASHRGTAPRATGGTAPRSMGGFPLEWRVPGHLERPRLNNTDHENRIRKPWMAYLTHSVVNTSDACAGWVWMRISLPLCVNSITQNSMGIFIPMYQCAHIGCYGAGIATEIIISSIISF
jgi:hypothetical protein